LRKSADKRKQKREKSLNQLLERKLGSAAKEHNTTPARRRLCRCAEQRTNSIWGTSLAGAALRQNKSTLLEIVARLKSSFHLSKGCRGTLLSTNPAFMYSHYVLPCRHRKNWVLLLTRTPFLSLDAFVLVAAGPPIWLSGF